MNARSWLADVRAHADPQLTCILVGNKVDLCAGDAPSRPREVSTKEAELWAQEEGLLFVEASAKSGENVEEAFLHAATDILGKIRRGVFDDNRVSNVTCTTKCFNKPHPSVTGCETIKTEFLDARARGCETIMLPVTSTNSMAL